MPDEFTSTWWNDLGLLSQTQGMKAQVWEYCVTHRSLSIRLYRTENHCLLPCEFYLYCVMCESLPQRTNWQVDQLSIRREGEDYVIEDQSQGVSFRCGAARLYNLRSLLDYWGGGIRREIHILRNGVTESGDLSLFMSHCHKPVRPVIAYWIRPIHVEPIPISATDTLEGYQRCMSEVANEIDRLQAEGIEVYWKVPGDRCGL